MKISVKKEAGTTCSAFAILCRLVWRSPGICWRQTVVLPTGFHS